MDFKTLSTIMQLMHKDDNCNYTPTTDSLEAIRDAIDSEQTIINGLKLGYTEFTSGSGFWTVPSGVKLLDILIVGGGGGGSGPYGGGVSGGGGGGGEIQMRCNYKVDGLTSIYYLVGSGGSGGLYGGTNGGSSTFNDITAEGGYASPGVNGGRGGGINSIYGIAGTTTPETIVAGDGKSLCGYFGTRIGGGGGGSGSTNGGSSIGNSGQGGTVWYGGGGGASLKNGANGGYNSTGNNAAASSGGGGGGGGGGNYSGGNGGSGYILVMWRFV